MQRHVYSNKESLDSPCVLFQDYNGFWAPLNDLYFSTSSKVLVSRHPESAIEEVVSHYCPQCLNKYSEDDVNKYANRCATCMQCPCCEALVTGRAIKQEGEADKCCLACNVCSWSSEACGIIGDREEDLANVLHAKEKNTKSSDAFAAILASLTTAAVQSHHAGSSLKTPQQHDTWSIHALDELQEKKASQAPCNPQRESSLYTYLHDHNRLEHEAERQARNTTNTLACTDASALSTFQQRMQGECTSSHSMGADRDQLLPRRMYLRAKKMLRCRRDVRAGKMSILVQPKTSPLEGDSSHKLHQGKWFLKDASACHHVPRVVITKLPDFTSGDSSSSSGVRTGFLHLEISNSKDSDVVVLLAAAEEQQGGLKDVSLRDTAAVEDGNSGDSSGDSTSSDDKSKRQQRERERERHPPFSQQGVLCSLRAGAAPPPPLLLRGYEDELLREDSGLPEAADFATEEGAEGTESVWGVLLDQHVAKVCVPVSIQAAASAGAGAGAGGDCSTHHFAEVLFSLDVSEPAEGDSAALTGASSVRVALRVAFPL